MRIEVTIEVPTPLVRAALAACVLFGTAGTLASESMNLTTTYPAPSGVYTQVITTGNGTSGALDTTLGRDAGNVVLAPGSGSVGVGTAAPAAKLHVQGTLAVVDGGQAAGKVMTSDANGVGSWQYCTYAP